MRTNILLDDKLLDEAFLYASVSTKRELIDLVLREYINNHRRKDLRDLRGKIKLRDDYDYKLLRTEDKDK